MTLFELLASNVDDHLPGRAKGLWLRFERWCDSRLAIRCHNCDTELDETDFLNRFLRTAGRCRKCDIALASLAWQRRLDAKRERSDPFLGRRKGDAAA